MKIAHSLHSDSYYQAPVVACVGFFDGVHLGHQKLFSKLNELKGSSGTSVAITFKNHPSTLITPHKPTPLINSYEHRLELLKKQPIDVLYALEFTEKIRQLTADDFISSLVEHLNIEVLLLGPNAHLGYQKQGNTEYLKLLSKKYGFKFEIVDFKEINHKPLSSTVIRSEIAEAHFDQLSLFLNRPYTIKTRKIEGIKLGRTLGFPTLNLDVEGLALPPLGVYKTALVMGEQKINAIANLGLAPSLQQRSYPVLEVHLLDDIHPPEDELLEVQFLKFIRPEKHFSTTDELKAQIAQDIETAKD